MVRTNNSDSECEITGHDFDTKSIITKMQK